MVIGSVFSLISTISGEMAAMLNIGEADRVKVPAPSGEGSSPLSPLLSHFSQYFHFRSTLQQPSLSPVTECRSNGIEMNLKQQKKLARLAAEVSE